MKHKWTLTTMNNITYTIDPLDIIVRIPAILTASKIEYKDILYINYCKKCHLHQTTTRHVEREFIDYFNYIKYIINKIYNNIIVIDNEEMEKYSGEYNNFI